VRIVERSGRDWLVRRRHHLAVASALDAARPLHGFVALVTTGLMATAVGLAASGQAPTATMAGLFGAGAGLGLVPLTGYLRGYVRAADRAREERLDEHLARLRAGAA
jgi:metal-dependent amidase/aminoacylase/carboxypeptidase family protein